MTGIRNTCSSNPWARGLPWATILGPPMQHAAMPRDPAQYVTIGLDAEIFAFPVDHVREILDIRPLSRIPNAPAFMVGMIDVRGQGVGVVDLRRKLGLLSTDHTEHTRIVVLEVPQQDHTIMTIGVIADRVIEVASLSDHELEPPPNVGIRWNSDYIQAVGRSNGAFVIIFQLSRLFSGEDAALLAE